MDTETQASGPEAGWYACPTGADQQRWWDGSAWTSRTRRPAAEPPLPAQAEAPPPAPPVGTEAPAETEATEPVPPGPATPAPPVGTEAPAETEATEPVPPAPATPAPPVGARTPATTPAAAAPADTTTPLWTSPAASASRGRRGRAVPFLLGAVAGIVLTAGAGAAYLAVTDGWFAQHPTVSVGSPITDLEVSGEQTPLRIQAERSGVHVVTVDVTGSGDQLVIADAAGRRLGEGAGEASAQLEEGTRYWIFLEGVQGEVDVVLRHLR